jgi:prevent-host-death family protein
MKTVSVHEAKTQFSKLLSRVARGEEILIVRAGKPIARLMPVGPPAAQRALGMDRGRAVIRDDFDAPLPPRLLEELESWDPMRRGR